MKLFRRVCKAVWRVWHIFGQDLEILYVLQTLEASEMHSRCFLWLFFFFFHYISSWVPGEERWGRGSDTKTPFHKWPWIVKKAQNLSRTLKDFRPLSHVKCNQILVHATIMELKEFKVYGATIYFILIKSFRFPRPHKRTFFPTPERDLTFKCHNINSFIYLRHCHFCN